MACVPLSKCPCLPNWCSIPTSPAWARQTQLLPHQPRGAPLLMVPSLVSPLWWGSLPGLGALSLPPGCIYSAPSEIPMGIPCPCPTSGGLRGAPCLPHCHTKHNQTRLVVKFKMGISETTLVSSEYKFPGSDPIPTPLHHKGKE